MTTTGQTGTPSNNQNTGLILVVGDVQDWLSSGREIPKVDLIEFVKFNEVTADLLHHLNPCVVLAPLIARRFDALDLAKVLCEFSFKGKFRVLCPALPTPKMILKEFKTLAPKLDFELLQIDDNPTVKTE